MRTVTTRSRPSDAARWRGVRPSYLPREGSVVRAAHARAARQLGRQPYCCAGLTLDWPAVTHVGYIAGWLGLECRVGRVGMPGGIRDAVDIEPNFAHEVPQLHHIALGSGDAEIGSRVLVRADRLARLRLLRLQVADLCEVQGERRDLGQVDCCSGERDGRRAAATATHVQRRGCPRFGLGAGAQFSSKPPRVASSSGVLPHRSTVLRFAPYSSMSIFTRPMLLSHAARWSAVRPS